MTPPIRPDIEGPDWIERVLAAVAGQPQGAPLTPLSDLRAPADMLAARRPPLPELPPFPATESLRAPADVTRTSPVPPMAEPQPVLRRAPEPPTALEKVHATTRRVTDLLSLAPGASGAAAIAAGAIDDLLRGNRKAALWGLGSLITLGMLKPASGAAKVARAAEKGAEEALRMGFPRLQVAEGPALATRKMSAEQLWQAARQKAHLVPAKSGGFVGAPAAIKSVDDYERLMADMIGRVQRILEAGADITWYQRTPQEVAKLSDDPKTQEKLLQLLGVYSQRQTVPINTNSSLQAVVQNLLGQSPRAGLPQANEQAARILRGERAKVTPKVGPFSAQVKGETGGIAQYPTNDTHMANAWGMPKKLTQSHHAFMDVATYDLADRLNQLKVGGKTDWTPQDAQTAVWIYQKAEDLMRRFPKLAPTWEAAVAEAQKSYADYLKQSKAHMIVERVPGIPGHLAGLRETPGAFQAFLQGEPSLGARHPALPLQYPKKEVTGVWQNLEGQIETNPADVWRPVLPSSAGGLTPEAKKVAQGVVDFQRLVQAQADQYLSKFRPAKTVREISGMQVPLERGLTQEEARRLGEWAAQKGYWVADTGEGLMIGVGDASLGGARLKKAMEEGALRKELEAVLPKDAGAPTLGRIESVGASPLASVPGSGKMTRQMLRNVPKAYRPYFEVPELREYVLQLAERDARIAKQFGLGTRADIQALRREFGRGGFAGVESALRRGIPLPLLLLGAGLGAAAQGPSGPEE